MLCTLFSGVRKSAFEVYQNYSQRAKKALIKTFYLQNYIRFWTIVSRHRSQEKRITTDSVAGYYLYKFWKNKFNNEFEHFIALSLDSRNRVNFIELISKGTQDDANIEIEKLRIFCRKPDTVKVYVAHNHPSNSLQPSLQDLNFTLHLIDYLKFFDIEFRDHFILTSSAWKSITE